MKPYYPFYHRNPNKFQYYYTKPFKDLLNHTAQLTIAVYIDKDNIRQETPAQVKWTKDTIYNRQWLY